MHRPRAQEASFTGGADGSNQPHTENLRARLLRARRPRGGRHAGRVTAAEAAVQVEGAVLSRGSFFCAPGLHVERFGISGRGKRVASPACVWRQSPLCGEKHGALGRCGHGVGLQQFVPAYASELVYQDFVLF